MDFNVEKKHLFDLIWQKYRDEHTLERKTTDDRSTTPCIRSVSRQNTAPSTVVELVMRITLIYYKVWSTKAGSAARRCVILRFRSHSHRQTWCSTPTQDWTALPADSPKPAMKRQNKTKREKGEGRNRYYTLKWMNMNEYKWFVANLCYPNQE